MSDNLKRAEDWFIYYLASPYSSPDEEVRNDRYQLALKAAKTFARLGYAVFVPIAYNGSWELDPTHKIDYSWNFWEKFDLPILDRCAGLILFEIPDWEKSKGVAGELEHCKEMGIPILSISLQDLDSDDILHRKMAIFQGMIKRNNRNVGPLFRPNSTKTMEFIDLEA